MLLSWSKFRRESQPAPAANSVWICFPPTPAVHCVAVSATQKTFMYQMIHVAITDYCDLQFSLTITTLNNIFICTPHSQFQLASNQLQKIKRVPAAESRNSRENLLRENLLAKTWWTYYQNKAPCGTTVTTKLTEQEIDYNNQVRKKMINLCLVAWVIK